MKIVFISLATLFTLESCHNEIYEIFAQLHERHSAIYLVASLIFQSIIQQRLIQAKMKAPKCNPLALLLTSKPQILVLAQRSSNML